MTVCNHVLRNTYRDSVVLMRLSQELESQPGVIQATAMMATPNNRELLRGVGLLAAAGEEATANDLVVAMEMETVDREVEVIAKAEALLASAGRGPVDAGDDYRPRSLDGAIEVLPGANLALISLPGEYAAAEARRALDKGLNVLLFSDNVPVEDEVLLKKHAIQQGLLMLGPDCGTTILQGVPLGFANAVPRGRIGLVSASGTGLQQVTCLLAASGRGVSQGLGVGGRDMSDAVGGMMMRECLRLLQEDDGTDVIVLISKPPGRTTADRLMGEISKSSKPCVLAFLGAESGHYSGNVYVEPTLEAATLRVLDITGGNAATEWAGPSRHVQQKLESFESSPSYDQGFIRGLFSGGTLCYEALWLLRQGGLELLANVSLEGVMALTDPDVSERHTLVDMGDDLYTVGRPHPMIDFRPRCRRLLQEGSDPEVGVVLMDVVLGYGSHADPASELGPAIEEAIGLARRGGRELAFVVSLCGTNDDPQGLSHQEEKLNDVGAVVVRSNALAARIALGLSRRDLSDLTGS